MNNITSLWSIKLNVLTAILGVYKTFNMTLLEKAQKNKTLLLKSWLLIFFVYRTVYVPANIQLSVVWGNSYGST